MKKKLVVLTGAGISAESGLKTFRDSNGLWENHRVEDVATPEAWAKDPELVLRFYNERRADAAKASPNAAHRALADLEEQFDVRIITQNVDDLHERGGSSQVLHLHGKLSEVRSVRDENLIKDIGSKPIKMGDKASDGGQLRPNIVWFGEAVPMIERAIDIVLNADIFVVVGTSLQVYPAAGLISYVTDAVPKYVIDTVKPSVQSQIKNLHFIVEPATKGVKKMVSTLTDS